MTEEEPELPEEAASAAEEEVVPEDYKVTVIPEDYAVEAASDQYQVIAEPDPLFVEVIYPIHGRGSCCEQN